MKIALICDTHFGCRNDSEVFVDYFLNFYKNIFLPQVSGTLNTQCVFHLGDMFDRRKFINYKTLRKFKTHFIKKMVHNNFHIIIGNHDTYFRQSNLVNSPELLLQDYNFHIYSRPTEIFLDDLKVLILPWINDENREKSFELIKKTDAEVCFGHLELQGFAMMKGVYLQSGYSSDIFKKFKRVFSGHYHHRHSKDNIFYLGSPYEMTFSDYDDPKGFHIFDTKTLDLTFVQNPDRMFHKIFYDDSKKQMRVPKNRYNNKYIRVIVKQKTNPYWFDKFITKIYDQNPANLSIVEDMSQLYTDDTLVDEAKSTLEILNQYINNLQMDLNKETRNELNRVLNDLYSESLLLDAE